ncbi:MAG: NAD-dependent deacylase [Pseudomonadota bacterium]
MSGAIGQIVILTGAGISADSGVDTFRDSGGIWAKFDYRDVATPEGFAADPCLVHDFYNARRAGLRKIEPNPAHRAIATLQREALARGGRVTLITQNVDDLHERGGSTDVWHMHGELTKARCALKGPHGDGCGSVMDWHDEITMDTPCPSCGSLGTLRPHVVWFNEMPMLMDDIDVALTQAELFVSIGTSGSVYPAAGFVHGARAMGIPCIELNLEPSDNAEAFSDARYGRASEIVPAWVDDVLAASGSKT